jgi:hypothetical protein
MDLNRTRLYYKLTILLSDKTTHDPQPTNGNLT